MEAHVELRRGVVRLGRRLRQERAEGALSANKLGVLGHLRRNGPATPGAIAVAERQRPQSLTRVFAELEQDGLIERGPGAADRRQALLSLTDLGRQALDTDTGERDMWLADALDRLNETEREVLRLAGRLMDRLADAEP
ncbi:MarR family winged helix-turn-helix transcriptional regulator [Streptomyces beihaiensis]|uniref:MarR family transcriptional regulator n=1 Tax=Streptomyces beihaiensis TaxID=2984495 RepID=A0ABT3TS77_9ACTN|nr:MarR family transcriptional regulator [Streptomyces beihaiensis]MCX3059867.1 MarR family transcriptional regulator [Streptomyces beihaiensis]